MSESFNDLKDLLNYATPEEKQMMLNKYPELKYDYNEVQDILNYATPEERTFFESKYYDLKPEAGYGEVLFNTPAGALAQTGQSTGGIIRAAEELLGTGTKLGESIADESLLAAGQLANEMNLQPDTWKNTIYGGVTSAAQQLPMIVATAFQPELAPLTLATMGAISGGQRYDEARRENYTPGQALLQGAAYGVAEAAGEYIPLGTLLDKTGVTPKAMATKLIKYIAQEEGSELGTEVMQWATDKLAKDITANKDANYQDLMPRLIETAKATLISAPILGGAGMLANAHFQNRELQNSIPPESIPGNEEINNNLNMIENLTPEQEAELVKQALSENQPEQTQPIEPEPIQQPESSETDSQAINNITELNNEAQANTQELKQDADEAINILQNAQEPQQAAQPTTERTNTPLATEPPASVSESNENVQPVTQEIPVNDINIHDDIQYKRNVDKNKVTNKLKGRVYNPQLAGAIDVFVNPEDGKTYVWNGHHRLQLAKENGVENVKVIYSKFNNPQEAKEAGLLKNLAEENGEPLDYRNFFKQKSIENKQQAIDFLKNKGIDVNKGLAEKGFALSQLSDYLTNEYEKGVLPENLATEIGKQLPKEADQNALYNHLKKVYFDNDKTITTNKLKDLIEFAKSAPKQTGEMDLFGDTEETNRLDIKSNISEFILKQIKNNKNLFKKLSNEDLAEAATKIGGIIDTAKASPEQQREALAEFNFKRRMFAAGDPISSALNEATQQVIDGQPEGKVKANTYMTIKNILEENNDVENSSQTVRGINEGQGSIGQNQQGIGEQQQSGNAPAESMAQNSEIEQKVYKIEQIKTIQDLINNQRNIADTRLTSVIDDKTAAINYKGKNYTVTETPTGLKFDEIFQAQPKVKQEGLFEEDKTDIEREQEAAQNTDDLFGEKARQEEANRPLKPEEIKSLEKYSKQFSATEKSQASDYGYNLAEQLNTQELFKKKFDYAKNSGLRNGNTFIKSLIQGDYQQIITDIQARRTNINDVEIAANTLSELDPSSKNNNDYYLEKIKVQLQPANSVKREITKNTQQNSPQTDTTDDFLNKVAEETGMSFDKEYKPENDIKNDVKLADIWEMPKPEYIEYMKKYLREVDPKLNISGAEFLANNQIGFWFNKLKKQKKIKSSVFRSLASSEKAELLASNPKLKVVSDATYQKEITEKKYPEHTKKTTPKEDNVSNDIVMDEETYLAINGASRQDIGEPALHKNIPENIKQKLVERQAIKDRELIEKRDQLRAEYNQKVAAGELRPPTRTEKLIETANSIGDSEAALAARRLLDKKGIQWKPSEKVFDEKTKENNPIKSQDEIDKMFNSTPKENIITDPARVQEIKNSIAEGELILKSGKLHGRNLSADELANVKRGVDNDKAKIGIKETKKLQAEKNINSNPEKKIEPELITQDEFLKQTREKLAKRFPNAASETIQSWTNDAREKWFYNLLLSKKEIIPEVWESLNEKQQNKIKEDNYKIVPESEKRLDNLREGLMRERMLGVDGIVPSGDAFYNPNIGEHKTPQQKNLSDTFIGLNRIELTQLAEDILNSTPEIHKRLRGNALGRFSAKDENGKIKLDAAKLKEADFQKITEVLAHEIGHAVDWKEGEVNNTLKRGNVLGHIAALAKFLKHTLNISIDEQPRFLEAKERRRLKAEAKNEVLADIEDKKNIPPELAVEISLLYQQKVKEYMEENGLVHKDYIANEMAELAQQFLGWTDEQVEAGAKWFYKPSELYANTFGAFLTNPQLLQEYAPTVSEMLYSYLKAKPATLKLYNYFQNKINSGERYKENLNYLRQRMINADVKQSEEMSKQSEKQGFKDWIMTTFTDRLYPVLKYASIAPGSESSFEILNKAQKLRSITDICEAHLKSFAPKIAKLIKDNKIDLTDLGLRAYFTRVVEERSQEGIIDITDEQLAKKLNSELESQYSPEQVATMDEIFKTLRDARQPLIDKLVDLGIYGEKLIEKLKDNKNYFTFDIVEHYDKEFGAGNAVSGRIQKQIGTLKATANPFVSTILKDIALTRMAIEMDFTKSALKFLGEKGINIQKAQTIHTDRGLKNLPPKASTNLGLVEVLEDGKLKGYYVPKDIAETLNNPSMEISVGLQYLSALNHMPRALFTSASIGFTVSNAIRDSIGSFLKLPHTLSNFGTFSKLYLREFKNALLNTQSEEKVNNLLSKGIIYGDRPMNFQPDPEITPWENILRKFGLSQTITDFNETNASKYARFLNTLMGTVEYLANPILNLSGRIEKASKIAGYDYLQAIKDKYGISENEIDMMTTELVGTPNAKRKGTFTPYMNNLMLFSNVMLQGYKAHATAYKMNKTEYLTKLTTVSMAPVLLMALCATGDDKDWWEKVSPYHKQNYNIIPLYWLGGKQYDKNGKALYLTLPKEELSRAISSTFWQAINPQNGSLRETLTSMFNVWGGEIPKTAPAITAAVDTLSYARGFNPYDSFRQQYVINQRTFDRQDLETDKAFATHVLNLFGLNTLYKIDTTANKTEQPKDTIDSLSGEGWPSVYGLNVAGRFLKASDAGERSAINDLKKDVKATQARELDLVDSALNKIYGNNKGAKITPEETEAMRKHIDYRDKQKLKYLNPDRANIKAAPKSIRQEVKKILNN